jgi:ABC-type spermidine/putrescine transport system permease subunit II
VLAIGLLTTFSVISMSLSLTTVIISHTVFCTAFVEHGCYAPIQTKVFC